MQEPFTQIPLQAGSIRCAIATKEVDRPIGYPNAVFDGVRYPRCKANFLQSFQWLGKAIFRRKARGAIFGRGAMCRWSVGFCNAKPVSSNTAGAAAVSCGRSTGRKGVMTGGAKGFAHNRLPKVLKSMFLCCGCNGLGSRWQFGGTPQIVSTAARADAGGQTALILWRSPRRSPREGFRCAPQAWGDPSCAAYG